MPNGIEGFNLKTREAVQEGLNYIAKRIPELEAMLGNPDLRGLLIKEGGNVGILLRKISLQTAQFPELDEERNRLQLKFSEVIRKSNARDTSTHARLEDAPQQTDGMTTMLSSLETHTLEELRSEQKEKLKTLAKKVDSAKDLFISFTNAKPKSGEKEAFLSNLKKQLEEISSVLNDVEAIGQQIFDINESEEPLPSEYEEITDHTNGIIIALKTTKDPEIRKTFYKLNELGKRFQRNNTQNKGLSPILKTREENSASVTDKEMRERKPSKSALSKLPYGGLEDAQEHWNAERDRLNELGSEATGLALKPAPKQTSAQKLRSSLRVIAESGPELIPKIDTARSKDALEIPSKIPAPQVNESSDIPDFFGGGKPVKETPIIKNTEEKPLVVGIGTALETIRPQTQKPERKRILSTFEKEVAGQTSVEDLAKLLVSKGYKDKMFGSGTRAVSGGNLADIISKKVLQAAKGATIEPHFFIPDVTLADKLEELLDSSLSWEEGVSEYGNIVFEKKDSEIKDDVAQKATENTIREVAAATNPGMWKTIKNWVRENKIKTGIAGGAVASAFLPKLFAFLSSAAVEQKDPHIGNNYENAQKTTQEAHTIEKVKEGEAKETSSAPSTAQNNTAAPKGTKVVDPLTGETFTTKPITNTSTPVSGIPTQSEEDVTPITEKGPVSGIPTQIEENVQPVDSQEYVVDSVTVADTGEPEIFFPFAEEKDVSTQEKPETFTSIDQMKNWFSQDRQKLAALERVLHYADGQEEKSANGQPNSRAYWWETMLLQNVNKILPTKAGPQNRNLTLQYRSLVGDAKVIRLIGLDDNQFMSSGKKLSDFDIWCKNSLFRAVETLEGNEKIEGKITRDEKEMLADTKQTLGEYLTQVVYLAEKYDVRVGKVPELTEMQKQKVQNFTPIKIEVETESSEKNGKETSSSSSEQNEEGNPGLTKNIYWADSALRGAALDGVGNSTSNLEWLNGPYQKMIDQYWNKQSDMKIDHRGYTLTELQFLNTQFEELRRRADSLGTKGKRLLPFLEGDGSLRQVDRVLSDIKSQLSVFQKSSLTI